MATTASTATPAPATPLHLQECYCAESFWEDTCAPCDARADRRAEKEAYAWARRTSRGYDEGYIADDDH